MRTGRSLTVCRSLLRGGGCLLRVGVCSWGVVSQHALRQTPPPREQNDRQVQKYYLGHNFVAAGNNALNYFSLNNAALSANHGPS